MQHKENVAKSTNFIIEATSEEEERSSIKGTNSFQKEPMGENNGILKETITSESFSKEVDNSEKNHESVRKEDNVTIVDQFNETRSLPEISPAGSKREIKNPEKIGDMEVADRHRCQRPFRDIIGEREQRREELEKMEGDLRQRLDMLECSMPAMMVWNIWRMSQGAPVCRIKRILEKQFKDARELSCRSTPSCHYDCRVREVEAKRKLALKKVEEARTLWSEKLATLEERKRKLDEARRIQEEQKNAIERLNEERRLLREAIEKEAMEVGELCRCSDVQCKQRHLHKVSSVTSVEPGDIRCLEKLQRLAEEEVTIKREIAELERREEAYMRTLQQADDLWSKMEGDMVGVTSELQGQLDMKTAANQQLANRVCELEDALEKCRARFAACRTELEKFLSIEKVEATIGRDDDVAKVADKEVAVKARVEHRPIGRADDVAMVRDSEVLAMVEVEDGETLARVEVEDREALARVALSDVDVDAVFVGDDKFVTAKPDSVDLAVDRPVDLVRIEDAESVVRPEDLAYEQQRFKEVREYLAELGSLEELYKDDGEPCAPNFVCNDVVSSPTGMTDEELIALGEKRPALTKERDEKVNGRKQERQLQKGLAREKHDVVVDTEKKEGKENEIPHVEIEKKVVEKVEKRIAEIVVGETATPRTIMEEAADDRLVTMPKDRAPEVKKIEADRDIVIQRDTILSWIDAIDTIRASAAKHPDCREVKKDADTLAEQVGTYIGIKLKKVEEEDATIITEGKQERVTEKDRKTKQNKTAVNESKLQDELIILKAKEMEPATKTEFASFPKSEEIPAEVKVPSVEDESELLPTLTKEKVPREKDITSEIKMVETVVENKKAEALPVTEIEGSEFIEQIVGNPKEISQLHETKITDIKETIPHMEIIRNEIAEISKVPEMEGIRRDAEKTILAVNVKEGKEIMPGTISPTANVTEIKKSEPDTFPIVDIEKEPAANAIEQKIKTDEPAPILDVKEESSLPDEVIEEKIEIKKSALIKEKIEAAESPQIAEMVVSPIEDKEKKEKILAAKLLPDVVEEETAEAEKLLPFAITEEKIGIIQAIPTLPPIKKEEEIEAGEEALEAEIKKKEYEKVEGITPPEEVTPSIEISEMKKEAAELPSVSDIRKKIETVEFSPIEDVVKKDQIEAAKLLPDVVEKETTEAEKAVPLAITEEKIEIIQAIPTLPPIKKEEEIEAVEEALEAEIKKKEYEKVEEITPPEEVTPSIEISEKEKEEKEVIPTKVPPSVEPVVKEEVPVERKKPEMVEIELKIPIAEIKLTEMEMPAIPLYPRLVAQPYLIIAKIKEKELLQIIPVKQPCECYLQPPIARSLEIPQTDVLHTEVIQAKIVRNEVVQTQVAQTEAVETQVVQITTQAVSTAEPPHTSSPIRIISEYLKPAVLKASSAEIAGDRPEITGRKMLWCKRLKDQSTVTTASTGSQTDKTSHVSHDRVVRDERERARVPTDELLRSIKIAAAGLMQPDTEREIRTINYGGRMACNCCLCGRTPISPSTGPRLELRPQMDAKTAAPPAVAAAFKRMFIGSKIDHLIPHDRLCSDCKARIQGRTPREKYHVGKDLIKKISRDPESCGCASFAGTLCRAVPRKRVIEKRDQACLAKIPKRKTNLAEQKRRDDRQSILEEKSTVEPFSPSCTCFKLEKNAVEPIRKGNCYCTN